MSIQSTTVTPIFAQRTISNPTIDSGFNAGAVFDGQGNDFLNPNDILGNVNNFSQGISPTNSGNLITQLVSTNPIAQNANSAQVLNSTNGTLNSIFSPNFGNAFFVPTGPTAVTPTTSLTNDLSNFNPLIWQNPNSLNVLLGTMDTTNKIFGGNGLFQPNLVPPLYPFISPNQAPFNNYVLPVAQQAQLFPNTFQSGSPLFQPVVGGTGSFTQIGLASLQLQAQIQVLQQDILSLQTQRENVLKGDQTGAEDKARVQGIAQSLQNQITAKTAQLNQARQQLLQLQAQQSQVVTTPINNGFFGQQPFVVSGGTTTIFPFQNQVALMNRVFIPAGQLGGQTGVIPVNTLGQSVLSQNIGGITINRLNPSNGVPAWIS